MELMEKENILAGVSLAKHYPEFGNSVLLTVTEVNRREEIDLFAEKLRVLSNEGKNVQVAS